MYGQSTRLNSSRGQMVTNLLCYAKHFRLGIYPAGIGKLLSGDIFQFRLLNCHSGDQVPDGLLNGRPVIPQGCCKKDLSCKRKFLSCQFLGKTLETVLMSIDKGIKQLRGSESGNIPTDHPYMEKPREKNVEHAPIFKR